MGTILLAITTTSLLILYSVSRRKIRRHYDKIYYLENKLSKYTTINCCPFCGSDNVIVCTISLKPKIKCIHCHFELTENNIGNSYLRLIRTWNYMSIKRRRKIK